MRHWWSGIAVGVAAGVVMALAIPALAGDDGVAAKAGINADRVDGLHARQIVRIASCGTNNAPDGVDYSCKMVVRAPVPGYVALTGSADTAAALADTVTCRFKLDGKHVPTSTRTIFLQFGDGSAEADCSTNAVVEVDAGTHAFRFVVDQDGDILVRAAAAQAIFTPFNGLGRRP